MPTEPTTMPAINLSDLQIEDIEVLVQEGSHGMPEFAASCSDCCNCMWCSCTNCDFDYP